MINELSNEFGAIIHRKGEFLDAIATLGQIFPFPFWASTSFGVKWPNWHDKPLRRCKGFCGSCPSVPRTWIQKLVHKFESNFQRR